MADAVDSKPIELTLVRVRLSFPVPIHTVGPEPCVPVIVQS